MLVTFPCHLDVSIGCASIPSPSETLCYFISDWFFFSKWQKHTHIYICTRMHKHRHIHVTHLSHFVSLSPVTLWMFVLYIYSHRNHIYGHWTHVHRDWTRLMNNERERYEIKDQKNEREIYWGTKRKYEKQCVAQRERKRERRELVFIHIYFSISMWLETHDSTYNFITWSKQFTDSRARALVHVCVLLPILASGHSVETLGQVDVKQNEAGSLQESSSDTIPD